LSCRHVVVVASRRVAVVSLTRRRVVVVSLWLVVHVVGLSLLYRLRVVVVSSSHRRRVSVFVLGRLCRRCAVAWCWVVSLGHRLSLGCCLAGSFIVHVVATSSSLRWCSAGLWESNRGGGAHLGLTGWLPMTWQPRGFWVGVQMA
jgi:hypothetical protein